jgi:hypothetical protein
MEKNRLTRRAVSSLAELLKKLDDELTPNPFQLVRVVPRIEENYGVCKHLYHNGKPKGVFDWKIEPCEYYCPAPLANPILDIKLRRDLINIFNGRDKIKPALGYSAPVNKTEHFRCNMPENERIHFWRPYADSIILGEHLSINNYHKNEDGSFGCNCPIELRYIVSSDPKEVLQLKAEGADKMIGEESRCYWYMIEGKK